MRHIIALATLLALTGTALAQFPPPGIYACVDASGTMIGTLSLLVAGDYQWQPQSGGNFTGQVASSADRVEALSGQLADAGWKGSFSTNGGTTTFRFATRDGNVTCALP